MESMLNFNMSKCGARHPLINFIIKSTTIKSTPTKTLLLINVTVLSHPSNNIDRDREQLSFTFKVLEATFGSLAVTAALICLGGMFHISVTVTNYKNPNTKITHRKMLVDRLSIFSGLVHLRMKHFREASSTT